MINKVDEAHKKVLNEFNVALIWKKLKRRGHELDLPKSVVSKTILIGNPRY